MTTRQHSLKREDFGRLRSGADFDTKLITVELTASQWRCLLIDQIGQKLSDYGRWELDNALRDIIKAYTAEV